MAHSSRLRARGWAVVAAAVLVVAGAAAAVALSGHGSGKSPVPKTSPTAPGSSPSTSTPTSGGFHTVGAEIVAPDGTRFTPYGITVFGLAYPDWQDYVTSDEEQISGAAAYWHINTIRIQVAPADLLPTGSESQSYLSAVSHEVALVEQRGLNVVICAQYERTTRLKMPTAETAEFWRIMANQYKGDGRVWFDLFNEPQLGVPSAGSIENLWSIWHNGGSGYVGMQSLVDEIRNLGAPNLILAEGVEGGESLSLLPQYRLTGANIVYAVHPYFKAAQYDSPSGWSANWGDVSSTVPVVVGEWAEYQRSGGTCVSDAPTLVPEFLDYLAGHHIGLIAWGLVPGILLQGDAINQPTSYAGGAATVCHRAAPQTVSQGSGQLIYQFFAGHDVGQDT